MADFVKVGETSEIAPGRMQYYTVNKKEVCIANIDGTFYAVDDLCSHAECNISDGDIEGETITCPCHDSSFDVRTGEPNHPPATEPLATFEVKIEGNNILILI